MSILPAKEIHQTQIGCVVRPYRKRQSHMIEQYTGTYDKVYHRYNGYVGFILPFHGMNAFITYQRDFDFLKRALPEYEIIQEPLIHAKRMEGKPVFEGITSMRAVQSQIIGQIETEKRYNNVWFVNLQTDSGKTILSTYVSLTFGLKTWICCYSKDILKQWLRTYEDYTTIPNDRIIVMTGKKIDMILAGELDPNDFDVFVSTPRTLDAFGDARSNYQRIGDLFKDCGIGLFVYDEAHRWVSDFVKILSCANPRYVLALSADFSQGDHEKEDMFRQVFRNASVLVPTNDIQQTLKNTMIRVVYFNSFPTAIEQNEIFNRYGFDASLYAKYEFKKQTMLKTALYILHSVMDERPKDCKDRSLVLFVNVQHVEDFCTLCKAHFPNLKVGRFHGAVGDLEKEDTKENADIIVATYSSFSTGLHTHDIKYILSTNQCNKVADNQAAGRSSNAYYFMLVDKGFSYCMKKLRTRLNYLKVTKAKDDNIQAFTYHPDIFPVEI